MPGDFFSLYLVFGDNISIPLLYVIWQVPKWNFPMQLDNQIDTLILKINKIILFNNIDPI